MKYHVLLSTAVCCLVLAMSLGGCPQPSPNPVAAIGVSAQSHTYALSEETWTLQVWNAGDAGTVLSFSLTADRPWVSCTPDNGSSTGSGDPVSIAVTVSRATLSPGTGHATLTVAADALEPVSISLEVLVDGGEADRDDDGLDDETEAYLGTDPDTADTDGDGLSDGNEVLLAGTLPLHADTDGDGTSDGEEVALGDDPLTAANAPTLYNETQHAIWDALDVMELQPDSESALAAGAAFLDADPNVISVYYFEGTEDVEPTLCAELSNGALFVVAEALSEPSDSAKCVAPSPADAAAGKSILNSGMPQHSMVFLDLYEPGTNESVAPLLAEMARDRGWDAEVGGWSTGGFGSVEWFKSIADYGVVYVGTHGAFAVDNAYEPAPGEDPEYRPHWYGIQTADLRNGYQDDIYLNNGDFAERRVFLGTALVDGPEDDDLKARKSVYYYVSNLFFETYCGAFEPHSLVWFNACKSGLQTPWSDPNSLPPMWETLLGKNAGIILGWDFIVTDLGANRAAKYLFSRLLGDNRFEGKTPPLRPYGFTDAWTALQEDKGYNIDTYYPYRRNLKYKPHLGYVPRDYGTFDQEEPILAPTITGLFLDLDDEELTLRGNFGDRDGEISVGNTSLAVKSWDVDDVVVAIGPNDHGLVRAKIGNVKSNAVPLTHWSWAITVTGEVDPFRGPEVEATAQFRGRADIHPTRPAPEDEADRNTQGAPWWTVTGMEQDGTFTYSFSGTFTAGEYRYEHSGGGTVPVTTSGSLSKQMEAYQGSVQMNPDAGIFQVLAFGTGISHVIRTKLSDNTVEIYDEMVSVPIMIDGAMEYYGAIPAGNTSTGGLTLEWQRIEPDSAPDDDTPA